MNSFGPQSFTTAIKRLVPNHSKFKKEAITLITSIIYEINNDFLSACFENNSSVKNINVKHVRESIKNIIPGELRKYAFAEADSKIMKYNSGLIDYKGPDILKEIGLDTRVLRKCLEQITQVVNSELTLSKDCAVFVSIIQKLANQIAEKAIETIGDKPEMSLEDMRSVVNSLLGEEMFQHSEGHAESNLEWYRADDLDFSIKPLIAEVEEKISDDENNFWGKCVQKTLNSKYSTQISKETVQSFEKILNDLIRRIIEETKIVVERGIDNDSISEEHVLQALKTLLPEPLFKMALCSAQVKLLNYRCGILKYSYDRKVEEEPITEVKQKDTSIVPDFRKGVKHIMNQAPCLYSKGVLPFMNDVLNEIGSVIVGKSSTRARGNDNVLSENDIIVAVTELLPSQLREHAVARIAHIQMELGQPCIQIPSHFSSDVIKPADIKSADHHTQSATEILRHIPSDRSDEPRKSSIISEQTSSPPSEVQTPPIFQSDRFVSSKQIPGSVSSDTYDENANHGGTVENLGINSDVKNMEMPIRGGFLEPRGSNSAEKSSATPFQGGILIPPRSSCEENNLENSTDDGFLEPRGSKSAQKALEKPSKGGILIPPGSNYAENNLENQNYEGFLEPRGLESKEKNMETSSLQLNKSERFDVSNEPQSTKSNNNKLLTSVNSEPTVQSKYQTNKENDAKESVRVESKTSNNVLLQTISSIISQMENPEEGRREVFQDTLQNENEYSFLPDEDSDSYQNDLMLDIRRKIYWLDVRPYEI